MRLKSVKRKPNDTRCNSADSGVSVALSQTRERRITKSANSEINELEEELDFEPFGNEFDDSSQNQTTLESQHIYSDESTVKDFNLLNGQEDYDSNYAGTESTTVDNSVSNVSIAHRRDMLPTPRSDAKDGRQNEYLPLCYTPSVSARTTLDSSSEDDSLTSETEGDDDTQDNYDMNQYTNQSGNTVEESSSPYSITQEEEERLLDSSEDESHDDNSFVIQNNLVETCHIGNARITLPTFVSNSPKEYQSNDLKRNNSTELRTIECKKKKKKWDLPFKPEHPFTYIFLEDIGYVDVDREQNIAQTEDKTNLSQPQFGSLLVICDKGKITCEKSQVTSQREIVSLSNNEENSFKLPLPPPKRPPTRPKRTVCNSEGSSTNLQIKFSNKGDVSQKTSTFVTPTGYRSLTRSFETEDVGDKDDAISILASSIGGDIADDVANLEQLEEYNPLSPEQPNHFETIETPSYVEDRVKRWVENVGNLNTSKTIPKPIMNQTSTLNHINLNLNNLNPNLSPPNTRLIQLNSSVNPTESQSVSKGSGVLMMPPLVKGSHPRVNFRDIPDIFLGLCYFNFFSGNCLKPNCSLAHTVLIDKFVSKIQRLDPKEAFKHFQFAMRFEKLFKEIYPSFISAFGKLKMQNELITCIKYFLQMKDIDCTEAISSVIKALQESGLSFGDAIEMISFNIGFLEHPKLADVLLDLITRTYDISGNWEFIKRIAKARGKIKPSIVSKIFLSMVNVYPVNKELCREIYNMIVKNNMTDLSQIREEVLIPVRTLIDFQDGTKPANTTSPPNSQFRPLSVPEPRLRPLSVPDPLLRSVSVPDPQLRSLSIPDLPLRSLSVPDPQLRYLSVSDPQLAPLSSPNPQELLAAHIDHKLIKERELYEREVEGTTVRARVDLPVRSSNYECLRATSSDNRSHSSGSDDRYYQPTPRLSPFAPREYTSPVPVNNQYLRNNGFSRPTPSASNSPFETDTVDLNAALRFEPPPEISEYVPENRTSRRKEHQEAEISLKPPRPIFGNPCYRSNFNLDESLHNLLPDSFEHVNINEKDVAKLNSVIKSKNGTEFYELLQYYKNPSTLQNFITMTVVSLKSSPDGICDVLISFTESFGSVNPDYAKDKTIKGIIEVIIMNSLFEIEKKGQWHQARSLLELFCDWDSLVSSKIFSKRKVTHMGRYIFLAKMLSKASNFHFTYEILQSPNLKLLGAPETWPYFYNAQADLESRNAVLKEFFKFGHQYYIIGVSDMYRRIFKYGGIYRYDAETHFNPMLIAMINEQQTHFLKYFLPDIDVYYKVMDKYVLRAFTIMLAEQLSQERLFMLYELCCERQIYTKFMGNEKNITVRNNMFNIELQLILNYYFYKMSHTRLVPSGNIVIQIKLMENKQPVYPKILQKCIRSIKEINNNVKKILKDHYSILTTETSSEQLTTIEIHHEQIQKWVQCNQRWFPIL